MKKFAMALLMTALVASCSSRQDELEDDIESNSGTTAHSGTSDDFTAGQGDTSITNGATAGGTNGTNGMAQPMLSDANILFKMAFSDTKEVNEGKIGVQKAKNADVKKFAQMLVEHHGKMLKDDQATAQKLGVTPAAVPNDPDSALAVTSMQRLNNATANFDAEFMTVQMEGHQKTLNDLNMWLNATQNADLKAAIRKAIPIVTSHLEQARTLLAKVNGTATGTSAPAQSTDARITTTPKAR